MKGRLCIYLLRSQYGWKTTRFWLVIGLPELPGMLGGGIPVHLNRFPPTKLPKSMRLGIAAPQACLTLRFQGPLLWG